MASGSPLPLFAVGDSVMLGARSELAAVDDFLLDHAVGKPRHGSKGAVVRRMTDRLDRDRLDRGGVSAGTLTRAEAVDGRVDIDEGRWTVAVIRLPGSCICGSDLWPYRGVEAVTGDRLMGHEYAGAVEEVGDEVTTIRPGHFVVGSFFVPSASDSSFLAKARFCGGDLAASMSFL